MKTIGIPLFVIYLLLIKSNAIQAQVFPTNFASLQIASGLDPTSFDISPDGRIFISEKNGKVRIIKDGQLLPAPFVSFNVDNYNEKGLQTVVLDPNFPSNNYVYVYYTPPGAPNRLVRYTANGDVALSGSEIVLLELDQLPAGVHNGGGITFLNGKLILAVGDNAKSTNSQATSTLMGKVLRLNTDGSIPTDNPFYNSLSGNLRSIYAMGVRNPYKMVIQSGTNKIFLNDVGAGSWEEINEVIAGKNYGWPSTEGYKTSTQTAPVNYVDPVYAYNRTFGCAITGGAFYNSSTSQFPAAYQGKYFFADYCKGTIKTIDPVTKIVGDFATNINRPIDIRIASDGTLYFLARGGLGGGSQQDNTSSNGGVLWKVNYTGNGVPSISVQPIDKTSNVEGSVTFSVSASGNPAPSYQWLRDGVNISGANSSAYTVSNLSVADSGSKFKVIVSNIAGSVTSTEATLKVISNQSPIAEITLPVTTTLFSGGDTINFAGTATDPEDGTLVPSAFTWEIALYHYDSPAHFHPVMAPTSGIKSGSFVIPTSGETSSNILFRIYLTVTDAGQRRHTDSVDVNLRKSQLTVNTLPQGLSVEVDGKSVAAPYSFIGIAGLSRTIKAPATQTLNGDIYKFMSWSDGGAADRIISFPSTNTTIVANYVKAPDNNINPTPGLKYSYYEGSFTTLPNFATSTPVKQGIASTFNLQPRNKNDLFGFRHEGYIDIPRDGIYTFYVKSDDGAKLFLGKTLLINNDGLHDSSLEKAATIGLTAGKHAISSDFFEYYGQEVLEIRYSGPSIDKQLLPASALFHDGLANYTAIYEAENATLSGPRILAEHPGYTGTGFADYQNLTNDFVEWTVNVPNAGRYTLGFRYALGRTEGRPLAIRVNNLVANANFNFPGTGTFGTWQYVNISADLNAGTNKIRATAIQSSGANVDHLKISNVNARLGGEEGNMPFVVFPQPAYSELNLSINSLTNQTVDIEILSSSSKKVAQFVKVLYEGRNEVELNVNDLANGMYLILIKLDNEVVSQKMMIQR